MSLPLIQNVMRRVAFTEICRKLYSDGMKISHYILFFEETEKSFVNEIRIKWRIKQQQ